MIRRLPPLEKHFAAHLLLPKIINNAIHFIGIPYKVHCESIPQNVGKMSPMCVQYAGLCEQLEGQAGPVEDLGQSWLMDRSSISMS